MTEQDKIKQYFENETVRKCVSVNKVNELANIPRGTLSAFLREEKYRYLSDEQAKAVVDIITQLEYR